MVSIAARYGKLHTYKSSRKGMREMMCSSGMQGVLVDAAGGIAQHLNTVWDGEYDYGPIGEGVYSTHHPSPIGAHAFVRSANPIADAEARTYDSINSVLGG